jgi:hypothetical protein
VPRRAASRPVTILRPDVMAFDLACVRLAL